MILDLQTLSEYVTLKLRRMTLFPINPEEKREMTKATATGSPLATAADKEEVKKPVVQCCVPDCTGIAVTRGLCSKCYSAASKHVKDEKATWEGLEKRGFAKPSRRDPAPNKFLEALQQEK